MNLKAPQRSLLRRQHNSCDSKTEQTFPRFFHLSIKHIDRHCWKESEEFNRRLCDTGHQLAPHHTMVPRNSTPGEFANILKSKWVGVIAIKTERT